MLLVASAGQHLHPDWEASGDLVFQDRIDTAANGAACVAKELDPSRGIDEDHLARLARICSRSPSHPDPRSCRALSTLRGSTAKDRNAKFTASRLVAKWYRCITTRQASSSISMFVRDIHP